MKLLQPKQFMVLALTLMFGYIVVFQGITVEQFLMVFAVVISFYFGKDDHRKE